MVVILTIAVFFYLKFNLPAASTEAEMVISFENGESRKFRGPVIADMTILEALHSSSLGGDFELRYSIMPDRTVSLAKIDGAINPGNRVWQIYLNKKQVNAVDIDKIKIRAGDLVEVKYE